MFLPIPADIYSRLDRIAAGHFLDKLSRYPICGETQFRPFFIIGSGRCGTTLLRRVLNAHPELVIPPETHVLGKAFIRYRATPFSSWQKKVQVVYDFLRASSGFKSFGIQVLDDAEAAALSAAAPDRSFAMIMDSLYRRYAVEAGKGDARWGDKSPLNVLCLNSLLHIFPDAQFVHILRNGIDVTSSMVASHLSPNVRHAAYRWKISVELCRKLASRLESDQFLELRYEKFVTDPKFEIRKICAFLGIKFSELMLTNTISERLSDVQGQQHLERANDPISATSIGRGGEMLTADQQLTVLSIIHKTMQATGYSTQRRT